MDVKDWGVFKRLCDYLEQTGATPGLTAYLAVWGECPEGPGPDEWEQRRWAAWGALTQQERDRAWAAYNTPWKEEKT